MLHQLLDIVLHLDKHLDTFVTEHGLWTYALLFLIIFAETGLVITPFLPGDSLLFAAGAIAARGSMNIWVLLLALFAAAVLGNTTNYFAGRFLAKRVLGGAHIPLVKKKHIDRTHEFFERYGPKTIVLTRFVPIVRTFAPFVAGVGGMGFAQFQFYNVLGGALWVGICTGCGYAFGNIPFVQKNFKLFVIGIVLVSLLPIAVEMVLAKRRAGRSEPRA